MFSRPNRLAVPLALAGALCVLLLSGRAHAGVNVSSNAQTSSGTLFHYTYSVTNATSQDLAILTFSAPTQPGALTNVKAPAGFFLAYDPGVGLFSLAEDADPGTPQTFAPGTTVSGFSFNSLFGPVVTPFEALDASADTFTGTATTPGAAPVPEASTAISLAAGLLGLALFTVRRRAHRAQAGSGL